ncbi:GH1 family beta-glucosidase [Arenibacter sp. M-2]|uniref:GH1 family beta-glucosidase n=1 Tax=Arenibacter sp. M-2 TaxID=3053612 RepID=UPI00256FCF6E|nr:GH1 family beta-glucosidase [Arenibacter sp. M-2]MDL5511293.1 GH1 family beta-glucosidase [Arenibacter sp. M-2]
MSKNLDYFNLQADDFGENFVWGVSTAAYQIEGAHDRHDKGPSIWDEFTSKKGNTYQNQHGNHACEFYHRFQEDILLMKKMNIDHFRLSLSWPRILPNGTGAINNRGIEFYNDVINFCLECGITPWVTLYHWDLPLALEEKGGWANREIVEWFQEYVTVCATNFGDRVKNWMVLNEPMVFTGAGYFLGVHAPGRRGLKNFLPSVHHAVLCQAAGGRILRSLVANAHIGTTFSCSQISPYRNNPKDLKAAERVDAMLNRLFIETSLGMGYPWETMPVLKRMQSYILPGDAENSVFDFDFVGIQNYTREKVKHSYLVPHIRAKIVRASKRKVRATLMDWEVYPPSIFKMIERFNGYEGVKKIIITENGAAFADEIYKGRVMDKERLSYLQAYLKQVHRAKMEGLKVDGYFVWTFTDNFEWAEGYNPRFGLVYVDFENQQRIIKSSGQWYSQFLGNRK